MLRDIFMRKISKIHDELESMYLEMKEHEKRPEQFCIGEAAECLRWALLAMQDAERKVA